MLVAAILAALAVAILVGLSATASHLTKLDGVGFRTLDRSSGLQSVPKTT